MGIKGTVDAKFYISIRSYTIVPSIPKQIDCVLIHLIRLQEKVWKTSFLMTQYGEHRCRVSGFTHRVQISRMINLYAIISASCKFYSVHVLMIVLTSLNIGQSYGHTTISWCYHRKSAQYGAGGWPGHPFYSWWIDTPWWSTFRSWFFKLCLDLEVSRGKSFSQLIMFLETTY